MEKNANKKFQTEQLIYTLDLIDHHDHHDHLVPHGHDDNNCCGSCKNQGTCSSNKSKEANNNTADIHSTDSK